MTVYTARAGTTGAYGPVSLPWTFLDVTVAGAALPGRRQVQQPVITADLLSSFNTASSGAVSIAAPEGLQAVLDRFLLRDYGEVLQFLQDNPSAIPLLLEASSVIPRYFGLGEQLILEIFWDPEDEIGEPELFLLVQIPVTEDQSLERLWQLDAEWWLGTSWRNGLRMNIDLEYV